VSPSFGPKFSDKDKYLSLHKALKNVMCGGVLLNSTATHCFSGSDEGWPLFQVIHGLLFISQTGLSTPLHHLRTELQPKEDAETQ